MFTKCIFRKWFKISVYPAGYVINLIAIYFIKCGNVLPAVAGDGGYPGCFFYKTFKEKTKIQPVQEFKILWLVFEIDIIDYRKLFG